MHLKIRAREWERDFMFAFSSTNPNPLDSCNNQGKAGLNLEARNSSRSPVLVVGTWMLGLSSVAFPRTVAGSSIRSGIAGTCVAIVHSGFACYAIMPVPKYFIVTFYIDNVLQLWIFGLLGCIYLPEVPNNVPHNEWLQAGIYGFIILWARNPRSISSCCSYNSNNKCTNFFYYFIVTTRNAKIMWLTLLFYSRLLLL